MGDSNLVHFGDGAFSLSPIRVRFRKDAALTLPLREAELESELAVWC